tara:strand:+ start:1793 stop:2455 length:663 start_codon:yes stop_codon:yes gene_type:complete
MKSKLFYKILHITFFTVLLSTVNIQCAKTEDVVPIDNIIDSTGTTDTIYYGFVLNEVLYDPPSGSPGDANGDGIRDPNDDEFVELVNSSSTSLDISGYKLYDADRLLINTANHEFPANTILNPGQAVVVFGGGTPTGNFGGSLVFAASGQVLNLNNSEDVLTVKNNNDSVLFSFDVTVLSNNPNESYTRFPDLYGNFTQHDSASTGILFSPGTRVDGTGF